MSTDAVASLPTDTREKIIRAALDVFAEKGFDAASTRQIAAKVGVNHGLIPYYFGTKQKLWQAAVDHAFADMQSEIDAALQEPAPLDPRERAARMIRGHVRFVARRPAFVRLMFEEGKRRGERMRWIVDRHVRPLYDAVAGLIAQAMGRQAGLEGVSPVHFFYLMAGATGLFFHQADECQRLSGVDPFDADVVETHARVVERILLGPPSPSSKETPQ
jgi:AcrR family transcriptional regulator